ncbi:ATP-binding protein [Lachnoclostridium phytofermentans]|uniref:histidine kinase n=1 Tax=Lachnoclostridium phytofermentans (strain ATCC 700394 / DSM 18823 / ISDg) TaxID=357809 RepID=A9KKF8_LACP7|nr:ATP-binding protein [Lachnoclostridium phytofermentans]ABX44149.1 histidine kinase [Lachnoclostridium phytofermentans ISDg]
MMPEISLNVLDVAQNSIRADATLIIITVTADRKKDTMTIVIKDNGCGMTKEQVTHVLDPFFTTRTTRKVGLGIPFFQYAATSTGGNFSIDSVVGEGTMVTASFILSHIDRMPLGDMTSTMHTLITLNNRIDFLYTYTVDDKSFTLDTREIRMILDGIPLNSPDVSNYIREFLSENKQEVDQGIIL